MAARRAEAVRVGEVLVEVEEDRAREVALEVRGAPGARLAEVPAERRRSPAGRRSSSQLGEALDGERGATIGHPSMRRLPRRPRTAGREEPGSAVAGVSRPCHRPDPSRSTAARACLAAPAPGARSRCCRPPRAALADREFLSVAVTDGGAAVPLVPGTRIRLGFTDTSLGASAGCNTSAATYRIDGGRLVVDGVAHDRDGLRRRRAGRRTSGWSTFLGSKPVIAPRGQRPRRSTAGSTVIRLARSRRSRSRTSTLVGPTWTVDVDHRRRRGHRACPAGATATLVFGGGRHGRRRTPAATAGSGTWKASGARHRDLGDRD